MRKLLCLLTLSLVLASVACELALTDSAERRVVVLLLDESISTHRLWGDMIATAVNIVCALEPGGMLGVLAVNDRSFGPEDVLMKFRALPYDLTAARVKEKWASELRVLRPRESARPYTAISRALRHAATFVNPLEDYKVIVILLSDLRQTPRMPTPTDKELRGLQFPEGAVGFALFANANSWAPFYSLSATWIQVFNSVGIGLSNRSICQPGDTGRCLSQVKAALSPWGGQ